MSPDRKRRYLLKATFLIFILFIFSAPLFAVGPSPPDNFQAMDNPSDNGSKILLTWEPSEDEVSENPSTQVEYYRVFRKGPGEEEFIEIKELPCGSTEFVDNNTVEDNLNYEYKIVAVATDGTVSEEPVYDREAVSSPQLFNRNRLNVLIALAIFFGIVSYFLIMARKSDRKLYIRPIAGLEAVEEAVGRATEMGKPILFITGLHSISDISTIAAVTILGKIALKTAEYESGLIVPCYDPITMTVCQETVEQAYISAGHPDAYDDDMVFYLTNRQFAFVAGVDGIMVREKPAANFFMGYYYAESLILAETGAMTGAIQIAGTDAVTQLPFFITACDYTLIGEELYAASAYLSKDPIQLASLKAQDYGKLIVGVLIAVGVVLSLLGIQWFQQLFISQ
jgi:hypothetical protein